MESFASPWVPTMVLAVLAAACGFLWLLFSSRRPRQHDVGAISLQWLQQHRAASREQPH